MRKLEIINKVSSQTGIDKSDVQETVEAVLITIKEALKNGESVFKFDQISDKFTLNIAFDQQLFGPIIFQSFGTLNLDDNSEAYGEFIDSKISLNWKKRSYEVGIFYQPHNQAGGISFSLFGFK